jgi:hypothetical protein
VPFGTGNSPVCTRIRQPTVRRSDNRCREDVDPLVAIVRRQRRTKIAAEIDLAHAAFAEAVVEPVPVRTDRERDRGAARDAGDAA